MTDKVIYILHKNGARGHYIALEYLLKNENAVLKHREFSVFSKLFKSITKGNFKQFKKQITNILFLVSLLFTKNKKIVLGIAPFDNKIAFLLYFLGNHKIYYHSSWTCWDKSFHPKRKKNSDRIFKIWRSFLEQKVLHFFVVTNKTKTQLLNNYKLSDDKISIVNHANSDDFYLNYNYSRKPNSFIYVGRLLPQKGILEMLDFFKTNNKATLTIVGDGKEKETVLKYAKTYNNIIFLEPIYDKIKLINVYKKHQFLILNSKKTKNWEELFGMIIIEAMSLGLIPIASNHSGPKEIISKNEGYIFNEGDLHNQLHTVIKLGFNKTMSVNNMKQAKQYSLQNISKKWEPILQ